MKHNNRYDLMAASGSVESNPPRRVMVILSPRALLIIFLSCVIALGFLALIAK